MGDQELFNPKFAICNIPYARELGVATVLAGSVQRAGDRVRVTTMCAADEAKVGCGKKRKWLLFNSKPATETCPIERRHHEKNNCHSRPYADCTAGIRPDEFNT